MTNVMMMPGTYPFMLPTATYQELTRQSTYRWSSQERLRRKPAQQYLGPGADEITLTGEIMPQFRGGLGQVENMRASAKRGKPLLMVDGLGNVWGDWVILSIEEGQTIHNADGTPNVISFTMTLREYGADGGGGIFAQVLAAASTLSRLF